MAFWIGLTALHGDSEFTRIVYCVINILLILASVLLQRTVFLIFGALGLFGYIMDLFYRYFSDSTLFPFILSFIGIAVVFLGILYNKKRKRIEELLINCVPNTIKSWLPRARRHHPKP